MLRFYADSLFHFKISLPSCVTEIYVDFVEDFVDYGGSVKMLIDFLRDSNQLVTSETFSVRGS